MQEQWGIVWYWEVTDSYKSLYRWWRGWREEGEEGQKVKSELARVVKNVSFRTLFA